MTQLLANFANSVLEEYLEAVGTSLALRPQDLADFPTLGLGDTFKLTLFDNIQPPEIVIVTAKVGDLLTVTRGAEGTSPRGWDAGAYAELAPTAETLQSIIDANEANALAIAELESQLPTGVSNGAFLFCAAVLL